MPELRFKFDLANETPQEREVRLWLEELKKKYELEEEQAAIIKARKRPRSLWKTFKVLLRAPKIMHYAYLRQQKEELYNHNYYPPTREQLQRWEEERRKNKEEQEFASRSCCGPM